eukprot:NODE_3362_length_677_cov_210.245223_g2025_i5.p3 GENE.NODE_3362_length_677_cov_210.245223_g2025_i5~~NODE_3362_length_677_cov_210.245223_g2025_i5.p3  ORF type:complete len:69 (-),score=39.43 NODE_3362_length_677_cov_210.245223_g2025_i5:282-488(-)
MPPVTVMASKKKACHVKLFNEGLAKIKASGDYASICTSAEGQKTNCCGHTSSDCSVNYNGLYDWATFA